MDGENRRKALLELLAAAGEPLSGSALAKRLGVSRQVIVQDIALLRATNRDILSTARGYLLYAPPAARCNRCFMVSHTTEQIADELNTIVDLGGKVLDVIITHPIYGTITVNLIISSRKDVQEFVHKIKTKQTKPLKELTDDIHYHTVEAESEALLDSIEKMLAEKKYLLS
nr:transcription repressor NadR [uncultured Eisenbergiella sp.]